LHGRQNMEYWVSLKIVVKSGGLCEESKKASCKKYAQHSYGKFWSWQQSIKHWAEAGQCFIDCLCEDLSPRPSQTCPELVEGWEGGCCSAYNEWEIIQRKH
jgi:hypothetical protein